MKDARFSRRESLRMLGAATVAGGVATVANVQPAAAAPNVVPSYLVVASGLPPGNPWTGLGDLQASGVNDHLTLQQAIDSVSAWGGGTVELSPSTFSLGGSVQLRDRVTVVGQGPATVTNPSQGLPATRLRFRPSSGTAVTANPAPGSRFTNIGLKNFQVTSDSSQACGVVLEAVSGLEVSCLGIDRFRSGLLLRSVWDSRIDFTRIDDCGAAGADPAMLIESTPADGDANSIRVMDCTFESSKSTDLLIRNGGGGRANKISLRGCKFEQASVRGDRLVLDDTDYVQLDGCNFYTGASLAGGGRIDVVRVSNSVDTHLRDLRFEAAGSQSPLNSWVRFAGGNNGIIADGMFFQTGSPGNPAVAAIIFNGSNQRVALGKNAVLWSGGSSPSFPLQSGSPSSII